MNNMNNFGGMSGMGGMNGMGNMNAMNGMGMANMGAMPNMGAMGNMNNSNNMAGINFNGLGAINNINNQAPVQQGRQNALMGSNNVAGFPGGMGGMGPGMGLGMNNMGAGMQPQQMQQQQRNAGHPQQQNSNVPSQLREIIFQQIQSQNIVPQGWQAQVSEAQRAHFVMQLFTSLKLLRNQLGPEEIRALLNQSALIEGNSFTSCTSRDHYLAQMKARLETLAKNRQQNSRNLPLGPAGNNQNNNFQQPGMGISQQNAMTNSAGNFNQPFPGQMPPQAQMNNPLAAAQSSRPQIGPTAQMQNNMQQMLARQKLQNVGQMGNQQTRLSGPQQQQAHAPASQQQQQSQNRNPQQQSAIRTLALPQDVEGRREVENTIASFKDNLRRNGKYEQAQQSFLNSTTPDVLENARKSGQDPFDAMIRKRAIEAYHGRRQNQGLPNSASQNQVPVNKQSGPAGNEGVQNHNVNSFLSQQNKGQSAQEAGEQVVPASNNQNVPAQQNQTGFLNMANQGQQANRGNVPNAPVNNQTGMPKPQQQHSLSHQNMGMGQNLSQGRGNININNSRPGSNVLMGHGLHPGGPQQSPNMNVLNQPLGPQGEPNMRGQHLAHASQSANQNVQTQQLAFNASENNNGAANDFNDPPLPPELLQRFQPQLANLPPDRRQVALMQLQTSWRQQQLKALRQQRGQIPQANNQANNFASGNATGNQPQTQKQSNDMANGRGPPVPPNVTRPPNFPPQQPNLQLQQQASEIASHLELPRVALHTHFPGLQIPNNVKTWGMLQKWLSQYPSHKNSVDMNKLNNLRNLHIKRGLVAAQSQQAPPSQQRPQPNTMPQLPTPSQSSVPASNQVPNPAANVIRPPGQTPEQLQGVPIPNELRTQVTTWAQNQMIQVVGNLARVMVTEQEVATMRQHSAAMKGVPLDQIDTRMMQTNVAFEKIKKIGQIDRDFGTELYKHVLRTFNLPMKPSPNTQAALQQTPNSVPMAPPTPASAPSAGLARPQPTLNRAQPSQGSPVGQPNTAPMAPSMTPQIPQMNGMPGNGLGLGRGMPFNNSQEQLGGLLPQQRAQLEAQFQARAAQAQAQGMTSLNGNLNQGAQGQLRMNPNAQMVPFHEREARLRQLQASAKQEALQLAPVANTMHPQEAEPWMGRLNSFMDAAPKFESAVAHWFMRNGNESIARDLFKTAAMLKSQQLPNGSLRLTLPKEAIRIAFGKVYSFKEQLDKTTRANSNVGGQQTQAQSNMPHSAVPAKPATATPIVSEKKTPASKASSKPSKVATPTQPQFPMGHSTPDGKPIYHTQASEITAADLRLPINKKRKDNKSQAVDAAKVLSTTATQSQVHTPESVPKPAVPVQPETQEQEPPKVHPFKCTIPGCEKSMTGFSDQAEQQAHEKDQHQYTGDAAAFCFKSLRDALGVTESQVQETKQSSNAPSSRIANASKLRVGTRTGTGQRAASPGQKRPHESDPWTGLLFTAEQLEELFGDCVAGDANVFDWHERVVFPNPPTPPGTPPAEEAKATWSGDGLPPLLNWDPFVPGVDKNEVKPLTPEEEDFENGESVLGGGFAWYQQDLNEALPGNDGWSDIDLLDFEGLEAKGQLVWA